MDSPEALKNEIKRLVSQNQTSKALELLANKQLSSLDKELIILNSRYNKIVQDQNLGTMSHDDVNMAMVKVNLALIDIADKIGRQPTKTKSDSESITKQNSDINQDNNRYKKWLIAIPVVILLTVIGYLINSNKTPNGSDSNTTLNEVQDIEDNNSYKMPNSSFSIITLNVVQDIDDSNSFKMKFNFMDNITLDSLKKDLLDKYGSTNQKLLNIPEIGHNPDNLVIKINDKLYDDTYKDKSLRALSIRTNDTLTIVPSLLFINALKQKKLLEEETKCFQEIIKLVEIINADFVSIMGVKDEKGNYYLKRLKKEPCLGKIYTWGNHTSFIDKNKVYSSISISTARDQVMDKLNSVEISPEKEERIRRYMTEISTYLERSITNIHLYFHEISEELNKTKKEYDKFGQHCQNNLLEPLASKINTLNDEINRFPIEKKRLKSELVNELNELNTKLTDPNAMWN